MQAALEMHTSGVSENKPAAAFGISRSTFRGRLQGAKTPKEAHKDEQKLTRVQERHLRNWIPIQDELGCPVSHQQVRDFASKVARRNGYEDGVGKNWLAAFLRRNPEVKTLKGKRIDVERFKGASTELIKGFFMLLMMPVIRKIKRENRYNMDEVGMMEGVTFNGLGLGNSQKKATLLKQPGSRSWISILECISAEGRVLDPLVIFKGKTVQQQNFPKDLDFLSEWNFTSSEEGWTNDQIALKWLKSVFIPQTKPSKKEEPRLLVVDGHSSHMTEDFLFECYDDNIFVLFLVPHSSHVLHPLDLAVFGPLKNAYRRVIADLASLADTSHLGKITFLINYHKARLEAITKKNACAGFKAAGL